MKGSMKKLAVFVMMAAIATFIPVATASAGDREWKAIDDHHRKAIVGEYALVGGGNCISTLASNWDPNNPLTVDPTKVSASSYHAYGTLTFKHDGTGTINFTQVSTHTTIPAPPPPPNSFWRPSLAQASYPFTYTITGDGEFTFAAKPGTFTATYYDPLHPETELYTVVIDQYHLTGWVSADHKTIVVATPAPEIRTVSFVLTPTIPFLKLICHDSHVCTRLSD